MNIVEGFSVVMGISHIPIPVVPHPNLFGVGNAKFQAVIVFSHPTRGVGLPALYHG